jgi:hypothetical protein
VNLPSRSYQRRCDVEILVKQVCRAGWITPLLGVSVALHLALALFSAGIVTARRLGTMPQALFPAAARQASPAQLTLVTSPPQSKQTTSPQSE